MNQGVDGLPHFGLVAGKIIIFIIIVFVNLSYVRKLKANNNISVPRMALATRYSWSPFLGSRSVLAWLDRLADSILCIVPTLSGLFAGFGLLSIFCSFLTTSLAPT